MRELVERLAIKLASAESLALKAAQAANAGHGINVLYHGQHYGWYRWDGLRHDKFNIDDFKEKIPIGKLEDVVAKLRVVKLEDYL
jgi:hypothetical protein